MWRRLELDKTALIYVKSRLVRDNKAEKHLGSPGGLARYQAEYSWLPKGQQIWSQLGILATESQNL
jgi:hypothetical protein